MSFLVSDTPFMPTFFDLPRGVPMSTIAFSCFFPHLFHSSISLFICAGSVLAIACCMVATGAMYRAINFFTVISAVWLNRWEERQFLICWQDAAESREVTASSHHAL